MDKDHLREGMRLLVEQLTWELEGASLGSGLVFHLFL